MSCEKDLAVDKANFVGKIIVLSKVPFGFSQLQLSCNPRTCVVKSCHKIWPTLTPVTNLRYIFERLPDSDKNTGLPDESIITCFSGKNPLLTGSNPVLAVTTFSCWLSTCTLGSMLFLPRFLRASCSLTVHTHSVQFVYWLLSHQYTWQED